MAQQSIVIIGEKKTKNKKTCFLTVIYVGEMSQLLTWN